MNPFEDAAERAAIRRDYGAFELDDASLERLRQAPRTRRDLDVLRDMIALMDRWRHGAERIV